MCSKRKRRQKLGRKLSNELNGLETKRACSELERKPREDETCNLKPLGTENQKRRVSNGNIELDKFAKDMMVQDTILFPNLHSPEKTDSSLSKSNSIKCNAVFIYLF